MGTTVGFVSGRKIVVFLLRGNNCRVCKWQENRSFLCCVGTTVGFVNGRKIVVFLLRGNNCRVCKWQENRRFSVALEQL